MVTITTTPKSKETKVSEAINNTLANTNGREGLFVIIPVSVSAPSNFRTVKTLKQTTATGDDVTANRKVRSSAVEMFDADAVGFAKKHRDNIKALFREVGFNLGNGLFLVSEAKVDALYRKIISFMKEYNAQVEDFFVSYPKLVQQQMLLNPKLKEEIQKHHPTENQLRRSFRFRIGAPQAVQVHACVTSVENILQQEGMHNTLASGMMEPIVESICTDLKHFWNYNLRNIRKAMESPTYKESFTNVSNRKSGVKGIFLTLLRNMQSKVKEAEALEPRLAKLSAEFEKLISSIPDKNSITDGSMYSNYEVSVRVNEFATRMSDPEYVHYLVNSQSDTANVSDDVQKVTELAEQIRLDAEKTETRPVTLTDLVCDAEMASTSESVGKVEMTELPVVDETPTSIEKVNIADEPAISTQSVEEKVELDDKVQTEPQVALTGLSVNVDMSSKLSDKPVVKTMADIFAELEVESNDDSTLEEPAEDNLINGQAVDTITIDTAPADFDASSVTIEAEDVLPETIQAETIQPQKLVEPEVIEPELQTNESLTKVVNLASLFADL